MKQKEFYGKGEKHVYVRKGDKGEILVTKTKDEELITEENTIHLDAEEARKLGIQLLKLGTEPLEGEYELTWKLFLSAKGLIQTIHRAIPLAL